MGPATQLDVVFWGALTLSIIDFFFAMGILWAIIAILEFVTKRRAK